jgi:GNAT superfamily N-acetyltransferase
MPVKFIYFGVGYLPMRIRKAKLSDVPKVVDLATELLEYHAKLDDYFSPAKKVDEVYAKHFRRCVRSRKYLFLVAEDDCGIVGYALGSLSRRPPVYALREIGCIDDMMVAEQFRRRGVGKLFLDVLLSWFREKGIKYIELSVHIDNMVGRNAWEKYGFKDKFMNKKLKL